MHTIKNWSQNVKFSPGEIHAVENDTQIINLIETARRTQKKLRVAGSMHSFSPLISTNDILITTEKLQGMLSYNVPDKKVLVKAGTKIHALGKMLHNYNLAQENLGDIDVQSIAGATATGTHGTGIEFGNLSTQISRISFINGRGEKIECGENLNPEVFKAAQISLGLLGVITEIELKVKDSYLLKYTSQRENIYNVLEHLDTTNQSTRNFEFLWFPYTQVAQTKSTNIIKDVIPKENKFKDQVDSFLENNVYNMVSYPTRFIPSFSKHVAKLSAKLVPVATKTNWSHKIYSVPRKILFYEMEYNIPYDAFKKVTRECMRVFEKNNFPVHFPTENRFVRQDDIYLSPAYKRDSAYIAFHAYKGTRYQEYFKAMEEICIAHGGRPHWGKIHTQKADYFAKTYPMWEKFLAVRAQMDPDGVFLSDFMRSLL